MVEIALHGAMRTDSIERVVIAATVGPGLCLPGRMKKLTMIFRWIPLAVANATSLILMKIPRDHHFFYSAYSSQTIASGFMF